MKTNYIFLIINHNITTLNPPKRKRYEKYGFILVPSRCFIGLLFTEESGTKVCIAYSKFLIFSCPCFSPPLIPQLTLFIYSLQILRFKNIY